jgi:hypothetical protein
MRAGFPDIAAEPVFWLASPATHADHEFKSERPHQETHTQCLNDVTDSAL